jgi:putative hydrolase of the HAD superfamily
MTAAIQIRKLARIGATPYIAQLVTSEEIGAEKPDARMFRAALRKLGVAAEEAIMIGDNLQKDCLGAQAIGIRSYLIGLNS